MSACNGNKIVIFGGADTTGDLNDVLLLDLSDFVESNSV